MRDKATNLLYNIVKKHITTTMVGALDSIEYFLEEEFEKNPHLRELYKEMREEILDRGHAEMLNFRQELQGFIVKQKYYFYSLVKGPGNGQQERSSDEGRKGPRD
jgi:hypothetical protein